MATTVLAVWLIAVPSPWVLLIVWAVLTYGACVWWAWRLNRARRVKAAVVWAAAGYLPVGVVNAIVAPFSLPLLVLAALIPGFLSVSYLSRRAMAATTTACFLATLVFATLAVWSPVTTIEEEVPASTRDAIVVLGIPPIAALLVFIAWQSHLEMAERAAQLGRSRRRLLDAAATGRERLDRRLSGRVLDQLADARTGIEHATTDDELAAVAATLTSAIDELRAVARGLVPNDLSIEGLDGALRGAAGEVGVAATVSITGVPGDDVAQSILACCVEAIDNVAAHAGPGASATIVVETTTAGTRFGISDNGVGFDRATSSSGSGLLSISDRVLALGGWVDVSSVPGVGTTVSGEIPLNARG